ncbi:uncharacterized protein KD926_007238 [Aspergillus affinis]|uniref:uncharacterized protein n=1 Tax=Aspergillus affinis TaxID=1070780 RepID=UPI0022FE3E23|nr:uncharacterized protein KD926_007238 [Aspergillus affinis]KAI9041284.1 hypothetical protein KD926_007238 [Aspergillus affinis]
MKGTSVLRFASWPKIHQPLPRTPRQSQQLLNALTSSFRRQLDQEHPSSISPSEQPHNGDSPPENPNSSILATDKHVQRILRNPLFRKTPNNSPVQLDEHKLRTEPMALFDDLVASGSVTTSTLRRCLQSQLWLASRHTGDGYLKAMRESRAGSRFVDWWFASGTRALRILFKSQASTRTLVKFMMAEGLRPTAMGWLDLLAKKDLGERERLPRDAAIELYRVFLLEMVMWELFDGGGGCGGVLAALQCFVQSAGSLLAIAKKDREFHSAALLDAAVKLHMALKTVSPEIPVASFEDLVKIQEQVWPVARRTAVLHLYHPTQANPTPFLQYAGRQSPDHVESWTRRDQASFMRGGFKALQVMLDQGRSEDASDLAQIMQRSLPALKDQKAVQNGFGWHVEENFLARVNLATT